MEPTPEPSREEVAQIYQANQGYWRVVCRNELLKFLREELIKTPAMACALDIGCGVFEASTLEDGERLIRADLHFPNLEMCRSLGAPMVIQCRGEAIPLASASLDLVYSSDVLEHIRDDVLAMREIARVLKPGGWLLVTVPAFPMLWSEHDEILEHCRRYGRLELSDKLEAAGFAVERLSGALFALFFPALAVRFVQNFTKRGVAPRISRARPPAWLNALLIAWHRFETRLMRYMSYPVGISLVALARKRD